ncbi:MAG: type II toxin-antitoxin system PemK/MazF family toxin [Deltaproteobacteria bacterium]|nr:type II toxin-antitoxin system PemK/MazF family toxin [Deltaproteobacteria bacterium]
MLRGEVWYAVWPNDPKRRPRPVLIVSNNLRNSAPNLLDVVAVKLTGLYRTDGTKKPANPSEDVIIKFKKETIVRCAAVYSIEKSSLKSKVLQLSFQTMSEVDERLRNVLDLH